jgi:hypothetical protein
MAKAPTYGRIQTAGKNERTLMGKKHEGIRTTAETWNGRIEVKLEDDGSFTVLLGTKYGMAAPIARGNVGDLDRHFIAGDGKVRYVDDNGTITEAEPITMTVMNPEVLG